MWGWRMSRLGGRAVPGVAGSAIWLRMKEKKILPSTSHRRTKKGALPLPQTATAKSTNGDAEIDVQGGLSEDEDEDGTLLVAQPGFNRLLLALRDEGVMHFVKYVSASAEGSRYDVCGEWQVGQVEEEDEEEI